MGGLLGAAQQRDDGQALVDLTPNDVHTLFQAAMGWTDSHLHECLAKLRPPGFWSQGGVVGEHDDQHAGLNDEDGALGGVRTAALNGPDTPAQPPYASAAQAPI